MGIDANKHSMTVMNKFSRKSNDKDLIFSDCSVEDLNNNNKI